MIDTNASNPSEEALRRKTYQQERLIKTARHLTESLEVKQVLHQIGLGAKEILDAVGCALYLLSANGHWLNPVVVIEPEYEEQIQSTALDVETSFTGQAVKSKSSLIFNDIQNSDYGTQIPGTPVINEERIIVAPLIVDDQVAGAMCLNRLGADFTPEDLALAETFAAYASTALKNAQAHDKLQREVAERKQAEQELRESETRYRTILQQSVEAIFQYDATSLRLLEGNPAFLSLLGYSAEEVKDLTLYDIVTHPQESVNDFHQRIRTSEGVVLGEQKWRYKDGGMVTVEVTASKIRLNGMEIIFVSARDVHERVQRQREREAILALATALRRAQTRADMLPIIAEQVIDLLQAEGVALGMRDATSGETVFEYATGNVADLAGKRQAVGEGISGQVIVTGLPHLNEEAGNAWRPVPTDALFIPSALAAIPLVTQNGPIGVLSMSRSTPITQSEVRMLLAMGEIAANAIQRETLHEQSLQHARNMAAVSSIGRSLAEKLDLPEICARLSAAVHELLPGIATVFISRFDPERELIQAVYGEQDRQIVDVSILPSIRLAPPGQGTQSEVIRSRKPLIVNHLPEKMRTRIEVGTVESYTQSALYVPMLAKDQISGVFQVQSYTLNRFSQADADLMTVVGNMAAIAIQNARLFEETQRRIRHLDALHQIDRAITTSFNLDMTLNVVLEQVISQLGVDAACVLQYDAPAQTLIYKAGCGFRSSPMRGRNGYAEEVALERKLKIVDLRTVIRDLESGSSRDTDGRIEICDRQNENGILQAEILNLKSEGFLTYFGVPLIAKEQIKGVLELYHKSVLEPDQEWYTFLDTLARQTAIAIDDTSLFMDLQRSNFELTQAYDTTLEGWAKALELRDKETEGHSKRVIEMTMNLAHEMGISGEDLVHLRRGTMLHDIGKMGIPDAILLKPGPLTDGEWEVMRLHPVWAYNLLSTIPYLRPALDIPYCHHEKWDGSGYPRGLKGEQIPLGARIFAVVDVWDALSSDRPYRKAWPEEKVQAYIQEQAGKHFDPQVVETHVKMRRRELKMG